MVQPFRHPVHGRRRPLPLRPRRRPRPGLLGRGDRREDHQASEERSGGGPRRRVRHPGAARPEFLAEDSHRARDPEDATDAAADADAAAGGLPLPVPWPGARSLPTPAAFGLLPAPVPSPSFPAPAPFRLLPAPVLAPLLPAPAPFRLLPAPVLAPMLPAPTPFRLLPAPVLSPLLPALVVSPMLPTPALGPDAVADRNADRPNRPDPPYGSRRGPPARGVQGCSGQGPLGKLVLLL